MHEFWIPGEELDQGYRNIRDLDDGPAVNIRAHLEIYWDQIKTYADENFREEFARQPDARFWEMYLFIRVLNAGKNLVERQHRPDNAGPDLLIEDDDGFVWIEAVTFGYGAADNPDRVPKMVFDGTTQSVPVTEVELRISSGFAKKEEKFRKYIECKMIAETDRNLIAINPGKVGLQAGYEGRGSPKCVLYPLGDQYVIFYKDSAQTSTGYQQRLEIEKASRAKVPIAMFADEQHNHVSGLIWSKTTLVNFLNGDNDLSFYPNATPNNPLAPGWIDWANEWATSVDENGQCQLTKVT